MTDYTGEVRSPEEPSWKSDVEMDVIVVRRYDTNDVLVGRQHFILMRDEGVDGDAYAVSSIARPPEPEE